MAVNRSEWPDWVRLGLWSVHSAGAAWSYFALSIAIAVGCGVYGALENPKAYWGLLLVFAALWYLLCIQWVNRHGQWGKPG